MQPESGETPGTRNPAFLTIEHEDGTATYVAFCHLCSKVKESTTKQRVLYELAFHYDRRHQGWTHAPAPSHGHAVAPKGTPCCPECESRSPRTGAALRGTTKHLAPGHWCDVHSPECSQNTAMKVCDRCGHRHVDRDLGQVLACTLDTSIEEGRDLQRRIVGRVERAIGGDDRG